MTWLDRIRSRIFVPGETLEMADRRALLFGAAVSSAGLLLPKAIVSVAPGAAHWVLGDNLWTARTYASGVSISAEAIDASRYREITDYVEMIKSANTDWFAVAT